MQKIALGICIGEEEYADRFHAVVFKNFSGKFRFYRYSQTDELPEEESGPLDAILLSDLSAEELTALSKTRKERIFYLIDSENEDQTDAEGIIFLNKYADVNSIVDEILKRIGTEISQVKNDGQLIQKTRLIGVYSLCESELQLPFTLTMAGILAEKERVLILDLQENSGFSQLGRPDNAPGLEDLLLLIRQKRPLDKILPTAIGHTEKVDFVYPARNTECLCEADGEVYLNLTEALKNDLDYDLILINFGARFQGFFALLMQCGEIYLMQKNSGLGKWREFEFQEEISRKGYSGLTDRFRYMEIPYMTGGATSFDRLVEIWKWNEFGDAIRSMALRGSRVG